MIAPAGRHAVRSLGVLVGLVLSLAGPAAIAQEQGGDPEQRLEEELEGASAGERLVILERHADEAKERQEFPRLLDLGERALDLAQSLENPEAEARARQDVGLAHTMLGEPEKGREILDEALALSETHGSAKDRADVVNALGITEYRLGGYARAAEHFEAAQQVFRELGETESAATSLGNLGATRSRMGDSDGGLEAFEQALVLHRQAGNERGTAMALNNIGIARQHLGRYADAIEVYLEALEIEERLGNQAGIARTYGNIGIIYKNLQQYEKALQYMERALEIHRETGDRHSEATDLNNIGGIYGDREETEKAVDYYRQALEVGEEMGDRAFLSTPLINLGDAFVTLERFGAAEEVFRRALALAKETGNRGSEGSVLASLSVVQRRLGRRRAARDSLESALQIAREIEDKEDQRDVHLALAELHAEAGDFERAYGSHRRYAELQESIVHGKAAAEIADMEGKYEAEKKQREIEGLRRDNELQSLRLRSERLRNSALVAGLLLVGLVLLLLFRRYLHLVAFWKSKSYVGHYRILKQVGSGGMGTVYKAVHVRERTRPVALKVLREEHSSDPVFQQRLKHEAVLMDKLDHRNIVKVYERGQYGQQLFVAMEWVEGPSLADVVARGDRLPLEDCLDIMRQLTEGVTQVHGAGIVHRDLKPANVMLLPLEEGGRLVKLLDFDIARTSSLTRLTETGVIVGTVGYLAPEQIMQSPPSVASDIYSLGVVFYELTTLERPFFGEMAIDVVRQTLEKVPVAPSRLRADVPPELDKLILDMLAKEAGDRPSAETVLTSLDRIDTRH